jgi:hypothetical protein
MVVWWVF